MTNAIINSVFASQFEIILFHISTLSQEFLKYLSKFMCSIMLRLEFVLHSARKLF